MSGKILHRGENIVYRFGKITAEKDLTSIFDHQITTSMGWGIDVLKSDDVSLSLEMGGGYRYSRMKDSEDEKQRMKEQECWQDFIPIKYLQI